MNFYYRFVEGTDEWEGIVEAWDTLNWVGVGETEAGKRHRLAPQDSSKKIDLCRNSMF